MFHFSNKFNVSLFSVPGKIYRMRFVNAQKIICIGKNKTGTTTISSILKNLGYCLAPQRPAELLIKDWTKGDFNRIIAFVKYNGQAFQDIPFSLPDTFRHVDQAFPNAKFILTERDSPEQWYQSLIKFHSIKFGNGRIPTKEDLMNAKYMYKGFAWEVNRILHDTPDNDPYHKETLIKSYIDYNIAVKEYFKHRGGEKFLVLNVAEPDALQKILGFLGKPGALEKMPWENRSR